MLRDARVAATIPTNDIARAREFYEQKLGLVGKDDPEGARYECADGTGFLVFQSSGKSSSSHTQLAFEVQDIEAEVAALASHGVNPDPVDIPGVTSENNIAQLPDGRGAWFKDPDGNVLAVFQPAPVPAAAS